MELYFDHVDRDVLVLAADGGLNDETARQLVDEVARVVEAGATRMVVDCARLGYLSAAGVGMLLRLHAVMARKGGDVKLARVGSRIVQALVLSGLSGVFHVHGTVAGALGTYRRSGRLAPGRTARLPLGPRASGVVAGLSR